MLLQGQLLFFFVTVSPKRVNVVCFSEGTPFSWWVGGPAPGEVQDFWGGALLGSRQCACGLHNACLDSHHFCNCDADKEQWY